MKKKQLLSSGDETVDLFQKDGCFFALNQPGIWVGFALPKEGGKTRNLFAYQGKCQPPGKSVFGPTSLPSHQIQKINYGETERCSSGFLNLGILKTLCTSAPRILQLASWLWNFGSSSTHIFRPPKLRNADYIVSLTNSAQMTMEGI